MFLLTFISEDIVFLKFLEFNISTIIFRQSLEACNQTIHQKTKFIVQESKLLELFSIFKECTSFCSVNVSRIQSTLVTINFKCKYCDVTGTWKNQEMTGIMPALNLLLSAGLRVSGNKIQFYSKRINFRICVLQD